MIPERDPRPYPPWWIERAEKRRGEIASAVEQLKTILAQVEGVRGALIFGSYARGEVGPESDLDFMVVQETDLPLLDRGREIRRALRLQVPYDFLVYTPEEFERWTLEKPFFIQAKREGVWLDAATPD